MTIGIDARFYGPSGKGLGRYVQRLIENLEKTDNVNDYVVFLSDENWAEYNPTSPRFRKVRARFGWYSWAEQFKMPSLISQEKIDLMHYPHFNVAVFTPCPFVVTIHDLILFHFPTRRASTLGPIKYFFKQLGYKFVISRAVSKSQKIITVSNYTKQDILKQFPEIPADKIVVTYEACDSVETGQLKLPDADLTKQGIKKPYLFYIGNAYPHKNLETLIDMFRLLDQERPDQYQLILVGKNDYFYQRLQDYAKDLVAANKVVFFGFAPQAMLADLYRNARLYVFPSLLEGFGLPPLEAMRYDLPVAVAGNSACPEILGDAALYFDPTDKQDILRVIKQGLDDPQLRAKLIKLGQAKTKQYSWHNCARQTLDVYNSIKS